MAGHNYIFKNYQTFVLNTKIKALNNFITINLPGKYINPIYNGQCNKVGQVGIGFS
jgi:hypothetical protein